MTAPLFLSWKRYQRRSDVLAEALGARVLWRPALARSPLVRSIDYVTRGVRDTVEMRRSRPPYVVVQTPPHVVGFAPYLNRVPYVLDGHNGQFQGSWRTAPGAARVVRGARLVLTHTDEADAIARAAFPGLETLVVRDPIRDIPPAPRILDQVFVVATVGVDEPMDLLVDAIEALPDVRFVTTAPLSKLDSPLRTRAQRLPNLTALSFLDKLAYEQAIASARAVLVLTDREATQPSGACEALSAARPLILSRTRSTERLFGRFATLVEHTRDSLVDGVRAALDHEDPGAIAAARADWARASQAELTRLTSRLGQQVGA